MEHGGGTVGIPSLSTNSWLQQWLSSFRPLASAQFPYTAKCAYSSMCASMLLDAEELFQHADGTVYAGGY